MNIQRVTSCLLAVVLLCCALPAFAVYAEILLNDNRIERDGQFRVEPPVNSTVDSRLSGTPWRFYFDGQPQDEQESVLMANVLPVTKSMASFYENWLGTAQYLYRKAYSEYGALIKYISFDNVKANNQSDVYVMYLELADTRQRVEITVCWRFEQSYCAEFIGVNTGDMPEMFLLTKSAAKAFEDHTTAPGSAPVSEYLLNDREEWDLPVSNTFLRIHEFTDWYYPEKSAGPAPYAKSGKAHINQADYKKALYDYNLAIKLNPDNADYYYGRAVAYDKLEMLENALRDYSRVIASIPDVPSYYEERGRIYRKLGETEKSQKDYDKAVELISAEIGGMSAKTYALKAHEHLAKEEYTEAISYYNLAIEREPDNTDYINERGVAYFESGLYEKALQDRNKNIELFPYWPLYYNGRGLIYRELGEFDKALNDYNKAIELEPDNFDHYYGRGMVYDRMNNLKAGINDYTKSIELNPDDASSYNNRGVSYLDLGEYESALEDFKKAAGLKPEKAKYQKETAGALDKLERYDEAITHYNKALELAHNEVAAGYIADSIWVSLPIYYHDRGLSYYHNDKYEKALDDYAKAIELNPTVYFFYHNRALVYSEMGEYEKAIAEYGVALQWETDALTYDCRAFTYLKMQEYDKAIADFTTAINLDPDNAKYYSDRAIAYRRIQEFEKANADSYKAKKLLG